MQVDEGGDTRALLVGSSLPSAPRRVQLGPFSTRQRPGLPKPVAAVPPVNSRTRWPPNYTTASPPATTHRAPRVITPPYEQTKGGRISTAHWLPLEMGFSGRTTHIRRQYGKRVRNGGRGREGRSAAPLLRTGRGQRGQVRAAGARDNLRLYVEGLVHSLFVWLG